MRRPGKFSHSHGAPPPAAAPVRPGDLAVTVHRAAAGSGGWDDTLALARIIAAAAPGLRLAAGGTVACQ
jgi:hypothetical protein